MGYLCVHGHFYQPPRENPWLEDIELQDSASPYHDWNERITAECYAPNTASPILAPDGSVEKVVNNYARISFNFGATLLAWLQEKAPEVYQAILAADQESQRTFSGHGNALAQPYNHMILPLANRRDKYTQVFWGIRDFEHRFGRPPEGMWLPETAVDLETLDILSELGIRFTILAQHQARRIRRIGSRTWRDVSGGRIDPTMVYELRLASGRTLNLFFYDGPISLGVSFEGMLNNGECFAQRLLSGFLENRTWPELVHIATDGEIYGHHHRRGDMALAYALEYITSKELAQLTNYGAYLHRHPPSHVVEIQEYTSWSCVHGVERWKSNCGCQTRTNPEWDQSWRSPLREALDWLRDTLACCYEAHGRRLFKEPWAARNDYIEVILDRSPETLERFFSQHAANELDRAEKITALKLLELQRHAMLMYTSCGWFFDELSGPETVQAIRHAGRAVQLAEECFGDALEDRFLERFERAKSNIPEHQDGRRIYEKFVRSAMVKPAPVGESGKSSNSFRHQLEGLRAVAEGLEEKVERLDGMAPEQRSPSLEAQPEYEPLAAETVCLQESDTDRELEAGVPGGETRQPSVSQRPHTLSAQGGNHQEEFGTPKAAASEIRPNVAVLVESLQRQTDTIRSIYEIRLRRKVALDQLVEVVARLKPWTVPPPRALYEGNPGGLLKSSGNGSLAVAAR